MKRTYGGRRGTAGGCTLDYRDILQTVDNTSTVFDALSIKNLKQLKRETNTSYATWSNQQQRSVRKSRKKKLVKKAQNKGAPLSSLNSSSTEAPLSACLTPDKSLRVNRAPDPFDQLCVPSPSLHFRKTDNDLFDQLLHSKSSSQLDIAPDNKWSFSEQENNSQRKNLTHDESHIKFDSIRKNDMNAFNSSVKYYNETQAETLHTSDMHEYKLNIKCEADNSFSHSIANLVNNIPLLKTFDLKVKTLNKLENENEHKIKTPDKKLTINNYESDNNNSVTTNELEPLTSTPYKKYTIESEELANNKSSNHLIENDLKNFQRFSKIKYPDNKSTINNSESDINISIRANMLPVTSTPYKKDSMNVTPICSNQIRVPKISIIKATPVQNVENGDTIDKSVDSIIKEMTNIKGYEHSGIKDNTGKNTSKHSVNIAEEAVLEISGKSNKENQSFHTSLTLPEKFDGEPFLGFTNCAEISISHTSNDLFNSFEDDNRGDSTCSIHSNGSQRNYSVNESDVQPNVQLTENEASNSTSISQSTEVSDSYETCSSDSKSDEIHSNKYKEVRVRVDRLRDSLFYEYYKNENNLDESSNTSSLENDSSVKNDIHNNDELFEDYVQTKIDNVEEVNINTSNSSRNSECNECSLSNSSVVSVISRASILNAIEDDYRESISISSDSTYTDTPEKIFTSYRLDTSNSLSSSYTSSTKSSQAEIPRGSAKKDIKEIMVSFVTTRRGNDLNDDSVIILDDSVENTPVKSDIKEHLDKITNQYQNTDTFNDVDGENRTTEPDNFDIRSYVNKDSIKVNEYKCLDISRNKPDSSKNLTKHIPIDGEMEAPSRPSIALLPGKKWERSLSVYRRQTMLQASILENSTHEELGDKSSMIYKFNADNIRGTDYSRDSVCERRESFLRNPRRSTIRIVKEAVSKRVSLSVRTIVEEDIGFLSESCDDTLCDISRLSLSDSRLEVTVLEKRQESARDVLLRRCHQTDVLPFNECYPDSVLKNCRKIGEGVYGEVYLYRGEDGRGRVMKVVPVQGQLRVNGEQQKTFQEVISEVIIAMELSALRAPIAEIAKHCDEESDTSLLDLHTVENATDTFNEVLTVRCVRGTYPARLLDLWELYDEINGSENDSPEALPPDQLYVVLELANAGTDLESYQFNSAEQAHALFYQVAFALAVGEEAYQFEHRDLHWGNVLIQPTDQKFAQYVLRGRLHTVPRGGVAATIIDYTLSRVSLPLAAGDRAALFNDLGQDEGLFHGVGDYQFDVYRHMREKTGNDWKKFEPYTNILWLHYTVDKMITALRYKRTNTKIHKHYIAKLKGIKNRLLDYGSAVEFVLTDNDL